MRKISNVFYITIGLIILAVGYGVAAADSFRNRDNINQILRFDYIRMVLHVAAIVSSCT